MKILGDLIKMSNKKVYTESEFAPLKRVVLAQTEAIIGRNFKKYINVERDIPQYKEYFDKGGDIPELPDDYFEEWAKERENLKEVLEKYGVEVQRPRLVTDIEKELSLVDNGFTDNTGLLNDFIRDPFITVGEHMIECSFRMPNRRLEVLAVRHILLKEAKESGCYYVAVPAPDISEGIGSDAGPYLEGGDVLVYGKTVFVGNSGRATNHEGVVWLRNYLGHFGYTVVEIKMDEDVLHLDCILSFPRDGLMIVCEDAMPEGLPEELKSWDKISVSKNRAMALATNGIPIDEKTYVTDIEFKNNVGKELEDRGIHVEYIDYKLSRAGGGAFRCSTQPLLRE